MNCPLVDVGTRLYRLFFRIAYIAPLNRVQILHSKGKAIADIEAFGREQIAL